MQGLVERNHLNNVIVFGIPVRAIYGGAFFPGCGLHVLEDGKSFSLTGPCPQPKVERAAVSYSLHGYVYGFEASIIRDDPADTGRARLRIGFPERIARLERRKSYRVPCTAVAPVKVGVHWKDERMETRAVDISRHGVGLLLTGGFPAFAVDSSITLAIRFPVLGDVFVTGTVRALRDVNGTLEMGVHFTALSSADQALLDQYISSRERELGPSGYGTCGRPDGFMITRSFGEDAHVFWCPESLSESVRSSSEAVELTPVEAIDLVDAKDAERGRYDYIGSSHTPSASLSSMRGN